VRIQKIRFERSGGIIGTEDPTGLFWVDHDYLRSRGLAGSQPCARANPVEAEIAVTTACNLSCACCYADATPDRRSVATSEVAGALRAVAGLDIFHVAFGGGEPLLHPDLLDLARQARDLNLVPTTSTNGHLVTSMWARQAAGLFGRINVSVDVPGGYRDKTCYEAITRLREAGCETGANFILTSATFDALEEVFRQSAEAGADSLLVLRPKPGGRGSALYSSMMLDLTQQSALPSVLLELSGRCALPFHVDCALAPLLIRAAPDPRMLTRFGASGCIAGRLLVTVDSDGFVHCCSHLHRVVCHYSELPSGWHESSGVRALHERSSALEGRCSVCPRSNICGGGCAAVNEFYGLSLESPDPDVCR
jgi:radical SAM protein with 4Fe4S-binding SPASM domain